MDIEPERSPIAYVQVVIRLFIMLVTRVSSGHRLTAQEKTRVLEFLRFLCSDFFSRYIPNESLENGDSVSRGMIRDDGDIV